MPDLRRWFWTSPLLLALLFVGSVIGWAWRDASREREAEAQTLIADTLSTAAQLRARIDEERRLLRALATQLVSLSPAQLDEATALQQGLAGTWQSLTWLDEALRELAQQPPPQLQRRESSQSLFLTEPLPQGGRLVLRYDPARLLARGVPWWLSRRYDVQLIDLDEQLIASLQHAPVRVAGERPGHRVDLEDGVFLELTLREPAPSGLRPLVFVLIAGFLPLALLASLLLRRQLRRLEAAESRWRGEAAWRAAIEDSALVGLRARDAEGRLLSVNRTFCEMVGRSEAELVGHAAPMPYWHPDEIDEAMQRSRRNLEGGAPRDGYETRWRHANGRDLDVLVFESPLVDAAGTQIGWLGTVLDITERKRLADSEARQVEAQAQAARLTMLGEIASTLAHELNQPLSAIASWNAGVINSLQRLGVDDAQVHGALQRLGEQAAQAGRVVQRIRQFLTRREPQLEPLQINTVIEAAARVLAKEFAQREVQLELRLDATLPSVTADAVLIEQVLINLLRNAGDALLEREPPRHIQLHSRVAGGFLIVEVCDNGPGLAGRTAEQLFAPFYSTKREGMGMGLAICRSIIEAHHGVLDAGAAQLGGARFAFSLPLS
jgi:two-component system sensor histidine kinase DctS